MTSRLTSLVITVLLSVLVPGAHQLSPRHQLPVDRCGFRTSSRPRRGRPMQSASSKGVHPRCCAA